MMEILERRGKQIGILSGWMAYESHALYINPDILLLDEPSTFYIFVQ